MAERLLDIVMIMFCSYRFWWRYRGICNQEAANNGKRSISPSHAEVPQSVFMSFSFSFGLLSCFITSCTRNK